MKLEFDDHDQLTIATLHGDLTSEYADAFRKAALERVEKNVRDFVLDVSQVEFIDSAGLEALLWLQETCAEHLGQVRLAQTTENVNRILEITRLAGRLESHEQIEAAIKSLR